MSRLIDADAVILSLQVLKAKNHKQWGKWENEITDAFIVGIDEFAEKEAQLQRTKGRWLRKESDLSWWYECSECGESPLYNPYAEEVRSPFCPWCGSEMRGEEDAVD